MNSAEELAAVDRVAQGKARARMIAESFDWMDECLGDPECRTALRDEEARLGIQIEERYTVAEVAEIFGLSTGRVRQWIMDGRLPSEKRAGANWIRRGDVLALTRPRPADGKSGDESRKGQRQ